MVKHRLLFACLVLLVASVAGVSIFADDAPAVDAWAGEWVNTDPNTRSTTKLKIALTDGKLAVHGFGKCHPTDCDWGTTPLHLCSVGDRAKDVVGFASWDQKFKDHHIVLRLKAGKLSVDSFDIYKDKSGRTNRSATEMFAKSRTVMAERE